MINTIITNFSVFKTIYIKKVLLLHLLILTGKLLKDSDDLRVKRGKRRVFVTLSVIVRQTFGDLFDIGKSLPYLELYHLITLLFPKMYVCQSRCHTPNNMFFIAGFGLIKMGIHSDMVAYYMSQSTPYTQPYSVICMISTFNTINHI